MPDNNKTVAVPKILTIDIETSPSLAYIWGMWDENIPLDRLIEPTEMLCFAAKWHGNRNVEFYSQFKDGKLGMIKQAHRLIDEADIVIHYNGRKFDMPHLRREFLLAELGPPSPVRQVDLFQVVKANFKFVSNKLDHVAQQLGLGGKAETGGFDTWVGCMSSDPKAWKRMERYNKQDVKLTENLYLALRPWITSGHPHAGLFSGVEHCCPVCGSEDLQKRGTVTTLVAAYQQYQCKNPECGAWSRSLKSTGQTTNTRLVGLG